MQGTSGIKRITYASINAGSKTLSTYRCGLMKHVILLGSVYVARLCLRLLSHKFVARFTLSFKAFIM